MLYPVKIEFKEWPSGSWEDWSALLHEPPVISKKVESENEGEAGLIVFDDCAAAFRNESGSVVDDAYGDDSVLTAAQRYLYRISNVRKGLYAEPLEIITHLGDQLVTEGGDIIGSNYAGLQESPLFEGMADFGTLEWPELGNLITFNILDKLSALEVIQAIALREFILLNDRALAQAADTTYLRFRLTFSTPPINTTQIWISMRGADIYDFTQPIIFPGELIRDPVSMVPGYSGTINYSVVMESWLEVEPSTGDMWNKINIYPPLLATNDVINIQLSDNLAFYGEKEVYGVDIINYDLSSIPESIKGVELLFLLVKSVWTDTTLIKKPTDLELTLPLEYDAVDLISESPFGTTPLSALKMLANTMKVYVYFNKEGALVIQKRSEDTLGTSGTTRTIGNTKVIETFKRKFFWNKIIDGVSMQVRSWMTDAYGDPLVGISEVSKQIESGIYIKPKNPITVEILASDASDNTQELLDAKALSEATAYLDFYGKRRSAYSGVLALDGNTEAWELGDNIELNSVSCFFTSVDIDPVEKTVSLEAVEVVGHDYDRRQIVITPSG